MSEAERLEARLRELHAVVLARTPHRHGWVRHFVKDFETNPRTQYKIHMAFTYIWLVNMVIALAVFIFAQGLWQKASVLYLILVSLYANFATDYGAVSAAEAAHDFNPPKEDFAQPGGSP